MLVILLLGRLRQEESQFKVSLGYKVSPCVKKSEQTEKNYRYQKNNAWREIHSMNEYIRKGNLAGHWWLMPVILATQEVEIRRTAVQSQPGQIVRETIS
jgi:hypothetical protein